MVVLVVDDDARVRAALATLLRGAGYRVEVASDGEQGFQLLCRLPVDVVLTDLGMPNVDGIELIRLVRRDPFLLHLPVIAMAPFGSTRQAEAKDVGATACADQPVRNEQIVALVQLVLDAAHDRLRSSGIRGGPLTRADSDSGSMQFSARTEEDAPPNSKRSRRKSQGLSRGTAEAPADWLISTAALVNEAISAGRSNEAEAMLETWLDSVLSDAHNGRLASNGTDDAAVPPGAHPRRRHTPRPLGRLRDRPSAHARDLSVGRAHDGAGPSRSRSRSHRRQAAQELRDGCAVVARVAR